jgi:catechol 2,3-dioxygenase-like lactoylglutathione lyase family enzyme
MMHAGILVGNLDTAARFYGGILGCRETWRGNSLTSTTLNWVNMRVPDGDNHVEFMLYKELPPPERRGSPHHVCLVVPDIKKAVAMLEARPARKDYARELKINIGVDNKRQVGLFDPDGTRVEMMEIDTIDGKPAPSSTLPPPR